LADNFLLLCLPGLLTAAPLTEKDAAAFQTTENLIPTVHVPPLTADKAQFSVEVLDGDGKVVAEERRQLVKTEQAEGQRFAFAPPMPPRPISPSTS
jgi:hypothetical protein